MAYPFSIGRDAWAFNLSEGEEAALIALVEQIRGRVPKRETWLDEFDTLFYAQGKAPAERLIDLINLHAKRCGAPVFKLKPTWWTEYMHIRGEERIARRDAFRKQARTEKGRNAIRDWAWPEMERLPFHDPRRGRVDECITPVRPLVEPDHPPLKREGLIPVLKRDPAFGDGDVTTMEPPAPAVSVPAVPVGNPPPLAAEPPAPVESQATPGTRGMQEIALELLAAMSEQGIFKLDMEVEKDGTPWRVVVGRATGDKGGGSAAAQATGLFSRLFGRG